MEQARVSPRPWLSNLRRANEVFACSRETSQWLPITLDYLGLHRLTYPYELRLRSGGRIVLREHIDVVVFWMVFARQHYPVAESHRVIVDIGANIGSSRSTRHGRPPQPELSPLSHSRTHANA